MVSDTDLQSAPAHDVQPRAYQRAAAQVAAKAVPHVVVVVVMPSLCFLAGRSWWGLAWGVGLVLAWNFGCQIVRWVRGEQLSTVLILALGGLLIRSSLAVAFHSARLYFLAPAVLTAGTGVAYIASAFTPTPLVARLTAEFIPDSVMDIDDAGLARLLRKGTLFYGIEQLLISAMSVLMVFDLSTTTYAAVHPLISWVVFVLCSGLALPLFRKDIGLAAHCVRSRVQAKSLARRARDMCPTVAISCADRPLAEPPAFSVL